MAKRDTSQPIPDLLEGYSPDDPASLALVESRVIAQTRLAFLETPPTQEAFIRIKNNRGRTPRVRVFEAGNQSGKTVGGVAEDIAHAMGFRPWLSKTDPDYRIPIRVPNSGFVGCEVAGQNLIQRIEPLFMEFIPQTEKSLNKQKCFKRIKFFSQDKLFLKLCSLDKHSFCGS